MIEIAAKPARIRPWERALLSIFILLGTYYASVILVRGMYGEASSNAQILYVIERSLQVWRIERWMGTLVFPGANALYWASEFAVIYGLVLVLFVFRRKYTWPFWRSIVTANVVACAVFVLIPMAPPWAMLDLYGPGIRVAGNAIGAFPSVHQADAVIVGRYFRLAFQNKFASIVGWTWEIAVALDVVITGNHYLLDVLAGGLLGWWACNRERRAWL